MTVLVASTREDQRQGLSNVDELPAGISGMLFEYDGPVSATFHMKDTTIPLDIFWFNGDGLVIGHTSMTPCPAEPCPNYRSPGPIMWALEVPEGRYQFEPGDRLTNVESE